MNNKHAHTGTAMKATLHCQPGSHTAVRCLTQRSKCTDNAKTGTLLNNTCTGIRLENMVQIYIECIHTCMYVLRIYVCTPSLCMNNLQITHTIIQNIAPGLWNDLTTTTTVCTYVCIIMKHSQVTNVRKLDGVHHTKAVNKVC